MWSLYFISLTNNLGIYHYKNTRKTSNLKSKEEPWKREGSTKWVYTGNRIAFFFTEVQLISKSWSTSVIRYFAYTFSPMSLVTYHILMTSTRIMREFIKLQSSWLQLTSIWFNSFFVNYIFFYQWMNEFHMNEYNDCSST